MAWKAGGRIGKGGRRELVCGGMRVEGFGRI